jgi:energy-coupling factor transporter ATP-binding protein EcfA2
MNWITEIRLSNYRAFGKPETINIPRGNHLLIYGENGSGKSSIYNGLKDFFASSSDATTFKLNKFEEAKNIINGSVELIIEDDGAVPIKIRFALPDAESNHRIPRIILANKFKGFLDYKRMLKVHSLEVPENSKPNIFDLLIKNLLHEHKIPNPKGGVTRVELLTEYNRIVEILTKIKSGRENEPKHELEERILAIEGELDDIDEEAEEIKGLSETSISTKISLGNERDQLLDAIKIIEAKEQLVNLDNSLRVLLGQVITIANRFLNDYFKNKISLDVNYSKLEYNDRSNSMIESLSLKIKYAGTEIEFYQAFLNEARLSSLAICIYLSSIKTFVPETDNLKILYLDDVFIGLDNTNRFPLLEIIKQEFIEDGFQVFISTYDREWFELSRHWLQTKVPGRIKSLELFIEDDGNPNTPDYPVVLPYEGNFAKAEAHFKAKDYPAAGNYLRKECESLLKLYLPENYKIDLNGNPINELEPLMKKLEELFDESEIPKPHELIDAVKIYRKALLNPTSHNDLKSSLFKKEIEEAFIIVEKLRSLPEMKRSKIYNKGDIFRYENLEKHYSMQLELADNLYLCVFNGLKSFSKHKYRIKTWTRNAVEFATDEVGNVMPVGDREHICEQARPLEEIFHGITQSIGIAIPPKPFAEIKIGATGTLNDLLQ